MTKKEKELQEIIPVFNENKTNADHYKALAEEDNAKIKSLMSELGVDEYCVAGLKAKVSVSTKITMDEDRLIVLLKQDLEGCGIDTSNLFYTKEFINMDELERMLYNNILPSSAIKSIECCKEEKQTKSLRVTKDKKAKVD